MASELLFRGWECFSLCFCMLRLDSMIVLTLSSFKKKVFYFYF